MGKTTIAWTDESSNPIKARCLETGKVGWMCVKRTAQCLNCYAEGINKRFGNGLPYTFDSVYKVEHILNRKELDRLARLKDKRVFVQDMSDLFGPWVPAEYQNAVLDVLEGNPRITPQLLTKYPEAMSARLKARWGDNPPPHIWVGTTWTGPESADWLLKTPAAIRYLSAEPMLEPPLDLFPWLMCEWYSEEAEWGPGWIGVEDMPPRKVARLRPGVNLVIFGCESGPRRRLCLNEWIREGLRQCRVYGRFAFVKQIVVDGRVSTDPAEWPEDLRVRQLPA